MHNDKRPLKYVALGLLLLLVLAGFVLFFGLRAQAEDKRFLPVQEVTTSSGLSVWLVEDKSLPVIALQYIFLDSGTALDPKDKQGLIRLLSNTMDEGAGDMDSTAFQKALSDHSITLRFSASRDGFGGSVKTLTRHKEKAFDLLALALSSPRFDEAPVARMKAANLSRLRSSLGDPEWMAARLINDKAYEGHAYAMNSGGTISGLSAITPEDLRDAQKKYLSKDRLLIAVTGDLTAEEVRASFDRIFAALPARTQTDIPPAQVSNAGKVFLYRQPLPQTVIQTILPTFGRDDPDYYALQVMNHIFGGSGFGSRLMDEAREKRGLTYGIYSSLADFRKINTMSISTSTKNESAAEMMDIIRASMEKMKAEKVSAQELADAKSYIIGSMPLSLSSTSNIASVLLSLRVEGLSSDYLDTYAYRINAVSADDIQRVAQRVLSAEKMVTALVGQPENMPDTILVETLPNVQ